MRLIDADALLEKMYKYSDNEGAKMPYGDDDSLINRDSVCFLIENAPTIEPEPHWIPCTPETMPEDSGEYLVSVIDEYDGNYEAVGVAWFAHKKDYNIKESEWRELGIDETVIAWMPLPAPYQPKEDES